MAKTRLNATERRAIAQKISREVTAKYQEYVQKMKDTYAPSDAYSKVKELCVTVNECIKELIKLKVYGKNDYCYISMNEVNPFNYEGILDKIVNTELNTPKMPYVNIREIEDDLILSGIDKDWNLNDFINKYIEKYTID